MSGSRPMTRATAVSVSPPPTLIPGRRRHTLGAALVGGSPQSSPSPSSSDRLSPLGRPSSEFAADHLPLQNASSQGDPSSAPIASTSGVRSRSLPLGAALEEVDMDADPLPSLGNDVDMESAMTRELARALKTLRRVCRSPWGLSSVLSMRRRARLMLLPRIRLWCWLCHINSSRMSANT